MDRVPGALGCGPYPRTGREWFHLRVCRTCGHVGCRDQLPGQHATWQFRATRHPVIEGYDAPEGGGGWFVHELMIDLPDRTPQRDPIPR